MNAEEIARELGKATRSGTGWQCLCPVHERPGSTPSLSLRDDGERLLWHCHGGCKQDEVRDALRARGLLNGGGGSWERSPFHHKELGAPSGAWFYRHADGRLAGVAVRYTLADGGKTVRPWRPTADGFECKAMNEPRPLYRLPELLADKAKPVLIVEGEKCAEAAAPLLAGYAVTTWAGGAKGVHKADWSALAGRSVTIWPDADKPGREAAAAIVERVKAIVAKVSVLDPGERAQGWDVADAIAEGWSWSDLATFVEEHARASDDAKEGHAPRLIDLREFLAAAPAPFYIVERILQRGYVYALTAFWGHGKTAAMIAVALHVAAGLQFGAHRVARQRVAVLCGENPDDTKLRVRLAAEEFGLEWADLESWLYFTEKPFAIDNALALGDFIAENKARGPFGLIVVDTGPAHSEADEENSNREQHTLATALRELLQGFGGPCVVVLMHPSKTATRENMQPRGGGAFSGGIDGELCLWRDVGSDLIELYHRTKFRGPGFDPIMLRLEKREASDVRDNFGGAAVTVIAKLTDEKATASTGKRRLSNSERVALDALRRCLANGSGKAAAVPPEFRRAAGMGTSTATLYETWRQECYHARLSGSDKQEAEQKAFKRAANALQAGRLVAVYENFAWLPGQDANAPDQG